MSRYKLPDSKTSKHAICPRHLFILGLHRSGTTMLANLLKEQPEISGFSNTGAPMDEGQYLQSVFKPFDAVGRYSLDPRSHKTEKCELATQSFRKQLLREWTPFWNEEKAVLMEKSPGNILRSRLLQYYFPDSAFILIVRHPVAACLAAQKWKRRLPLSVSLLNWVRSHRIIIRDSRYLKRFMSLRYEDFVQSPSSFLKDISEFLNIKIEPPSFSIESGVNEKYFEAWRMRWNAGLLQKLDIFASSRVFERAVNDFGYSFRELA